MEDKKDIVAGESEVCEVKPAWWHFHRRLYNWMLRWADTKYGFVALIVLALLEPIFVPIPADVMVIGMSMGKPKSGIKYGLICSIFSVIGGTIALLLGMMLAGEDGRNIIDFFSGISVGPVDLGPKVEMARDYYQKYDVWAVGISALTPVPYMLFSWLGGLSGISVVKFILVSLIGRSLRFGTEGVIFYFFGQKARYFIEKYFNLLTVLFMVLVIIVVITAKFMRH